MQHILDIALPTLYLDEASFQPHPLPINIQLSDIQCVLCQKILNSPVKISSCGSFLCSSCLLQRLEQSNSNNCPVCYYHSLTTSEIKPLDSLHIRLLHGIIVKCNNCKQSIHLSEMKAHNDTCGTTPNIHVCLSANELTAIEILSQPLTSPPTSIEQRVASNVLK